MTKEEAIKEFEYGIISDEAVNMAIEALKQEPCEDCVSRQAVKDGMIKYGFHASDMTVTEFVEDMLNPVTPKGVIVTDFADKCRECGKQKTRWILVSERLPKEKVKVLTQDYEGDIQVDWLVDLELRWFHSQHHIVAWQPLPKPYKAEKEDK